jgi:glucokinase
MKYAIGVDIGGTKTAFGIVNDMGEMLTQKSIPTNLNIEAMDMIQQINREIASLLDQVPLNESDLVGIGIGAPGPLNSKNGMITCPPNLESWRNIEITKQIQEDFSIPVYLENDASAAALAEKWVGAGKDSGHFLFMTISTGIGSGIVSDGKLIAGASGNAGDIGHMVIDPSYGQCVCGQHGCFEMIASGTAIAKQGSKIVGKSISTKEVFNLYDKGEEKIVELVNTVFEKIGIGCVSLINIFDPEKIIIGGGVSKVGEPLFSAIRNYVEKYALNPTGRKTEIVPAGLNQDAGVIGAAAIIFNQRIVEQSEAKI